MSEPIFTSKQIDYLLSPTCIRDRAKDIFDLTLKGETHFSYKEQNLDSTVDYVLGVIKENYPDLNIPYHSRWGHFQAGEIDRKNFFSEKISHLSEVDQMRSKWDLTVISVLLDAGAGNDWSYADPQSDQVIARSEGLAVASLHMFENGAFSDSSSKPFAVSGKGLSKLTKEDLINGFQVSSKNPLLGLDGRLELCHKLGLALENGSQRVSDFFIPLLTQDKVQAIDFYNIVMNKLSSIWPGRVNLNEQNMGDLWSYSKLGKKNSLESFVPFHKLSQWLTYSLIEPFEEAGHQAANLQHLTGLAEYRNGGLLLDLDLIGLNDEENLKMLHKPESEIIIEWRALTIHLLDMIGNKIRKTLKLDEQTLPLVKILEGGTWHAGRKIAKTKRTSGAPPLNIESDGTVF